LSLIYSSSSCSKPVWVSSKGVILKNVGNQTVAGPQHSSKYLLCSTEQRNSSTGLEQLEGE